MTYTSLQNKAAALSWASPRDTGSNRVPQDTQRNIDYGWITALAAEHGKKTGICSRSSTSLRSRAEQEQYLSRRTRTKMHAQSSAAAQTARTNVVSPPGGKESAPAPETNYLPLCSDIAGRTVAFAMIIGSSLARFDAQLDEVMARACKIHLHELRQSNLNKAQQAARLQQAAMNCSLIASISRLEWNQALQQYWNVSPDQLNSTAMSDAPLAAARFSLQQLTTIVLAEGTTMCRQGQHDQAENVGRLLEVCVHINKLIDQAEERCQNALTFN